MFKVFIFLYMQVGKPKVGENRPSRVRADVTIDVKLKDFVRQEWEGRHYWIIWYFIVGIIMAENV